MSGGELFDRLVRRGAYSEEEARAPFRQVAEGLLYLHQYVDAVVRVWVAWRVFLFCFPGVLTRLKATDAGTDPAAQLADYPPALFCPSVCVQTRHRAPRLEARESVVSR